MPRGFLVKRSKKSSAVSYRVREERPPATELCATRQYGPPCAPYRVLRNQSTAAVLPGRGLQSRLGFGGMADAQSPNRPVSADCPQQRPSADHMDRNLNSSSPVQAESFPEPSLTTSRSHMTFPPSLAEMTTQLGSACRDQESPPAKRPAAPAAKAKKQKPAEPSCGDTRCGYRDEVTTSPVLGLRIKEMAEGDAKPRSVSPLGEFVCQLCKERYADPLALAQHRCSRIVRVDYRCSECDKVFSCPANLASHRRWHKPRSAQQEGSVAEREEAPPAATAVGDNPGAAVRDARAPSPQRSDAASGDEAVFSCPLCCKTFRRPANLRKHLALHSRQADKKLAPSYLGRHAAAAGSPGASHLFPCRFCGESFFSSPGLTRHVNKCHPTESRRVIVLPQTG